MLGSLRKFSNSILAKLLLGIITIPFVFWGMGSVFTSGNTNVVVTIEEEKYLIEDFTNFINKFTESGKIIKSENIDNLLTLFITEKLVDKEVDYFNINLSDESLSKLVKHQKDFKRDNKFSRTEYEKFLIENGLSAVSFENNLAKHEKKKQLLNFISGGLLIPHFLVNSEYDKKNQKRKLEIINLNKLFKTEINVNEDEIKKYYQDNENGFEETFKSIKIVELTPNILVGSDEFNELFFSKIDEIDNLIAANEKIHIIVDEYNLGESKEFTFNKSLKNKDSKIIKSLPSNIIEVIFDINYTDKISLIEDKDKYFLVETINTEKIVKSLLNVKNDIIDILKFKKKEDIINKYVKEINNNNFSKQDFLDLSNKKNLILKKETIFNSKDYKIFKKEIVDQIYAYKEKEIIIPYDPNLKDNFIIYIDKIEHVYIDKNNEEYKNYVNSTEIKLTNNLYITYDKYIKEKYKIEINYRTLDTVKNYFN